MTFDLGMWPLTTLTYESSHVASMIKRWLQLDFNFSNETNFTLAAYNLTLHDLWPWYVTLDLINIWRFPWCIYDPRLVAIGLCMKKIWTKQKLCTIHEGCSHKVSPNGRPNKSNWHVQNIICSRCATCVTINRGCPAFPCVTHNNSVCKMFRTLTVLIHLQVMFEPITLLGTKP
jgi:hypothetical protein